jgi:hypothetical protein
MSVTPCPPLRRFGLLSVGRALCHLSAVGLLLNQLASLELSEVKVSA